MLQSLFSIQNMLLKTSISYINYMSIRVYLRELKIERKKTDIPKSQTIFNYVGKS